MNHEPLNKPLSKNCLHPVEQVYCHVQFLWETNFLYGETLTFTYAKILACTHFCHGNKTYVLKGRVLPNSLCTMLPDTP